MDITLSKIVNHNNTTLTLKQCVEYANTQALDVVTISKEFDSGTIPKHETRSSLTLTLYELYQLKSLITAIETLNGEI